MKVVCVIPAYNRAFRLPEVVSGVKEVLEDVVVVNDGSTDDMAEVLGTLPVHLLTHPINRGQGAALRTGTEYALNEGAEIIVHFDADGQFRAADIGKVIAPLKAGEADIVFGSRFLDNTTAMPAFKEKVIMPLARFVNRYFFNIRLTDPQSGFRAFTAAAAPRLDWEQDRMAHTSAILASAHANELRIKEVPITVLYHEFGQKFSGGLKIIRDLFLSHLNR